MRPGFDLTVASRQGLSFAGLTVEHLPEQHCMRPGFVLTVAARQGRSLDLTVVICRSEIAQIPALIHCHLSMS